ncbi:3,4-dihydroxy-2-butanone 4-phosphate synthase [Agaricicola taiwanensis]|uniref:3,4-dihydroxy-2-butanone 4-phosphate synthase n=1 Tax=Agaricicola taiwanensis TaxID=591372 RepID=A0A8J2YHL7_9RHOB|nr:3,4-dihydroxy-2-butanone-4-phosphate synthase [Agaricicola taiwanensis]GGE43116.1 3,4-dihydroxy-2-butanone 4-phosphate synthase [Agaricicola taiwanensis]
MKLNDWLTRHNISRSSFARSLGIAPATVTALCNDPSAWISREMAEKITRQTKGEVTPNDLLGLAADMKDDSMDTIEKRVQSAVEAFAQGEILVVTDDYDRENEGDLIVAAVHATPEKMAFIVRYTSGIVCAPITSDTARRLRLSPMVADNDAPHSTAFTVSVDYRHGTTTGISADDRTATVRGLANNNAGAADFVRPGHIFPLIAKDGGVLIRSGHTEAAVDLCKLASLDPVGVICEMVNDDGSVMRGPQVAEFAARHKLKHISVADLIAYRQAREKLVERISEFTVDTEIGQLQGYAYVTPFDRVQHLAFVYGRVGDGRNVPARLHRADAITDVFGGAKAIHQALSHFKSEGRGVLVYLRDGAAGVPLNVAGSEDKTESESARHKLWREVGLGAQILKDLGVGSINLLASRERHYVGLSGFGIEIENTEIADG